jgi:hypothetical protein
MGSAMSPIGEDMDPPINDEPRTEDPPQPPLPPYVVPLHGAESPAVGLPEPPSKRSSRVPSTIAVVVLVSMVVAILGPPLVRALQAGGASTEFRFLATEGGEPVRWNPCEPIHYVVNTGVAPAGSLQDVQDAVVRVSGVTGIPFVFDGLTDEVPSPYREPYLPQRYGARWAPVLIGWVDPRSSDFDFQPSGHDAAAVAGPLAPDFPNDDVYVSGVVAINLADPNPPGFGAPGEQGPVLLHELAHVLGLGHVRVGGELMEPSGGGVIDYGPGDIEGLERLGRSAGCLATPPVPAD